MATRKTIALTRRTFVDKVMSLLFNMLSRLLITFLPRSKCLLISWLQSPYLAIKKNEILPFRATWVDIENITLSEISQRKAKTILSLICGI